VPDHSTKRSREKREVWAKRVERWADSGLTCREFSSEIGVNPRTLIYWKWRLGKEAPATGTGAVRRTARAARKRASPAAAVPRGRAVAQRSAPTFMELVTAPAEPVERPAEPVEIIVRSVTVRVPQTAAAELVRRAFEFAEKLK